MITYVGGPIDFHWQYLPKVEDVAAQIGEEEARALAQGLTPDSIGLEVFLSQWKGAQEDARASGWEGDFRSAPVVFFLPGDDSFEVGFVIKQDNNGTTFVMSPRPLPHFG